MERGFSKGGHRYGAGIPAIIGQQALPQQLFLPVIGKDHTVIGLYCQLVHGIRVFFRDQLPDAFLGLALHGVYIDKFAELGSFAIPVFYISEPTGKINFGVFRDRFTLRVENLLNLINLKKWIGSVQIAAVLQIGADGQKGYADVQRDNEPQPGAFPVDGPDPGTPNQQEGYQRKAGGQKPVGKNAC